MTYKELLLQLQQLNEEQLNQDVAVYDEGTDEYYQLKVELVFATIEFLNAMAEEKNAKFLISRT